MRRLYILETPELCLSEYDSWFHTFVLNISGSSCIGLNTLMGRGQVLKVSSLNLLNSLLTLFILMVLFCAKMFFFFLG